ncbi:hypothetical protein Dtox_1400 [Desulfofarcimen acetoxidans DSM 771]|uniref:Uncharacterized protein n=2 Tax=Desulfofarcimen acetoxidans TaxID=58138 RepID=C8W6I7_DESAS|nr:hypothetical protein Dtox_1400 [Desulfofarcimen acetoxidans DSM 771]
MQEGNYTQAAQYVSSQTAVEYQTDIPSFLTLMSKGGNPDNISRWTSVKVISEQIDGTKAVVKVKITAKPDGKETTYDSEIPMSKEDDIWKLRLTSRGYVIQ